MVNDASSASDLSVDLLKWQHDAEFLFAEALGDALALVWLLGRSEVLDEVGGPEFSEATVGTQTFSEAQEFLRQKVSLPSNTWTETLHQFHDRAFVVAGATSVSLVEDLRGALQRSMAPGGGGLNGFREAFDEIIERTGWDYNGGRNWRTRVIFETNLRTAHMAGRLAQMRDPDMVRTRPFWQYVHGEIREPKQPREEHMAWDGKVFRHDDPIWAVIYPPNGWRCSCGVRSLSAAGLRRLGKSEPDTAPALKMRQVSDPVTGEKVNLPEGIDFGWAYQPGDTWQRGVVPREYQKPLSLLAPELPLPANPGLEKISRPFATPQLPAGNDPEFYVSRFMQRFGGDVAKPVFYRDRTGQALIISDDLFKNFDGTWKATKFGREVDLERMAEAIMDPDEIWADWGSLPDGSVRLMRRYLRWHVETASYSAFEWNPRGWSGVTSFAPRKKGGKGKVDQTYLERHRRGALLFRRR